MKARWILPPPLSPEESALGSTLANDFACPRPLANILARRSLNHPGGAAEFLCPRLKRLGDPFLIPEMRTAVDRTLTAIDTREPIVLFGDYDVDGVTSLAILTRLLRAYGADPKNFLPSRMEEGYGMTKDALQRCVSAFQPQLIIALDCGTSAPAEIAGLAERKIDVVVIDHHECQAELPQCSALVNPKRDPEGDFHYLCSAGLVFKFCHALLKARPLAGFDLRDCLDMVALGTVADIVPLTGENRILVAKGLEVMARTRWPGLRALMEVAQVTPPLTPADVGFKLGPRLNASGRLGAAEDSLELLLTDDPARARELALELDGQNRDRQSVERTTLEQAAQQLTFDPARDAAIVVGAEGWHPGVVGIVASRICRKLHRPTFVVGFDENGLGKGSGRSIAGFSLVTALESCENLLEKFGGHEMAAGLSLRQDHFEDFRAAFQTFARKHLTASDLLPRIVLDGEVELADIDLNFLSIHDRLQPFGTQNSQPVFLARGVAPAAAPAVLKQKHLRLKLAQNGATRDAIFFGGAEEPVPPAPWDVAFRVERNEWRGRVSVQLQIQRLRAAE